MTASHALKHARPYRFAPRAGWRLTPLAGLLALAFGAHAAPMGGQVSAGAASISANGSVTRIDQSSQRAVIDWRAFSIGAGETVRFQLPGATAAILNRVTGGSLSAIYGNLQSNGRVFLINPNGVVIGPSGVVQAAGFVATTRNVDNEQFMAGGPLTFAGNSAAVVRNLGSIGAGEGDVVLAGQRVENAGTLAAPQGTVALVAGKEIWYAPSAQSSIVIRSGIDAGAGDAGVDNSGLIRAAQVELRSAGGNPWSLAVQHSGIIDATTVTQQGGRVLLSADVGTAQVGGTIRASGSTGGEVRVLGAAVKLQSTAALDASGASGGGTLLVGGDYQGNNPQVRNARTTTVAAGAQLRADAVDKGQGGKVIVWADDKTEYAGAISARGGAQGGDGGFAEVSGKSVLHFAGTADLRAPQGKAGELLLDPTDITIGSGLASTHTGTDITTCPGGVCSGTGSTSFLSGETLAAALATANVTVTTVSAGSGFGDITIDPLLCLLPSFNTPNALTLNAERDILVNGPMSVVGGGALALLAGRNISVAPTLNGLIFNSGAPLPYALTGGNGGLTLVAGRSNANGTINIGADSNLGSQSDASGTAGTGPIRVFGTSAANTVLTGWDQAFTAPVASGKVFGDAGTDATGIYYAAGAPAPTPAPPAPAPGPSPAPTPAPSPGPSPSPSPGPSPSPSPGPSPGPSPSPSPAPSPAPTPAPAPAPISSGIVVTYSSGQVNFGLGAGTTVAVSGSTFPNNWIYPEPFVPEALNGGDMVHELMAMLGGPTGLAALDFVSDGGNLVYLTTLKYQQYFSAEVERNLYFVLAIYTQPPATQTDLATALVNVMHTIEGKKPYERTTIEQQTLHDLSLAVESAKRYGMDRQGWDDQIEIVRAQNELQRLQTSLVALQQRAAISGAQSTSGPLNIGLGSLFSSNPTDRDTAVADTEAQIRALNATIRNLQARQGQVPQVSDFDAMVRYLSRTGAARLLAK